MRWKTALLRTSLLLLLTLDLLAVLQFRRHGWPVKISGQSLGDGSMQIFVTRPPFTAVDWLLAILLVGAQALVVYGNWRVGRRGGRQR